jgi:hypothetical protein
MFQAAFVRPENLFYKRCFCLQEVARFLFHLHVTSVANAQDQSRSFLCPSVVGFAIHLIRDVYRAKDLVGEEFCVGFESPVGFAESSGFLSVFEEVFG